VGKTDTFAENIIKMRAKEKKIIADIVSYTKIIPLYFHE
jgi:hypothetical protein